MQRSPALIALTLLLISPNARAQEATAPTSGPTSAPTEAAAPAWGLNFDLGFYSAYVFRGANVFQQDGQMNQHMFLAPSVTWKVFDTGLSVGYWGAYQIVGENLSDNIDGGLGLEQDLIIKYERAINDALSVSGALTWYFSPFADEAVAGTSAPSFIEPALGVGYSNLVDLGLNLAYFFGVQDAIRDASYFYINPTVGKSFELNAWLGAELSFGYGFKIFNEGNEGASNAHDLLLSASFPITALRGVYFKPSLNLAWTNIEGEGMGFSDGIAFWGGLNIGTDL